MLHAEELGVTLYAGFLDAKSAFDVVWTGSLLRRLNAAGIQGPDWLVIKSLHEGASSAVKWKGEISDKFNISQGVRQGGVLSTLEYKEFVNPLLHLLSDSGAGSKIGTIDCCAPTCADDITVLADSPEKLQLLLNIVHNYSIQEQYQLQPTKCSVMVFNNKGPVNHTWYLGKEPIPMPDVQKPGLVFQPSIQMCRIPGKRLMH